MRTEYEQYGSVEDRVVKKFILTGPSRAVDRVTEQDLARRMAIVFIPGVINGVIREETTDGTWEYDFDNRLHPCYPEVRFYPRETFPD